MAPSAPARRCVFCDQANDLTREHVWPDWLNDVLSDPLGWTITHSNPDRKREWERQTPRLDQTVRRVCGKCNHGWMSDLEGEAQELITHMLFGNPVKLDPDQQDVLLRWSYKTTLTLSLASETSAIPIDHMRHFYEHRKPWPSNDVRVGCYIGTRWTAFFRDQALFAEGPGLAPTLPNGYVTAMTLGHLLVHTIGTHSVDRIDVTYSQPGAFHRLWPPKNHPIRWPPLVKVDDAALDKSVRFGKTDLYQLVEELGLEDRPPNPARHKRHGRAHDSPALSVDCGASSRLCGPNVAVVETDGGRIDVARLDAVVARAHRHDLNENSVGHDKAFSHQVIHKRRIGSRVREGVGLLSGCGVFERTVHLRRRICLARCLTVRLARSGVRRPFVAPGWDFQDRRPFLPTRALEAAYNLRDERDIGERIEKRPDAKAKQHSNHDCGSRHCTASGWTVRWHWTPIERPNDVGWRRIYDVPRLRLNVPAIRTPRAVPGPRHAVDFDQARCPVDLLRGTTGNDEQDAREDHSAYDERAPKEAPEDQDHDAQYDQRPPRPHAHDRHLSRPCCSESDPRSISLSGATAGHRGLRPLAVRLGTTGSESSGLLIYIEPGTRELRPLAASERRASLRACPAPACPHR